MYIGDAYNRKTQYCVCVVRIWMQCASDCIYFFVFRFTTFLSSFRFPFLFFLLVYFFFGGTIHTTACFLFVLLFLTIVMDN